MLRPQYDTREKLQNYIDTFVSQNPTHPLYINDTGITSLEGIKFPESITWKKNKGIWEKRLNNCSKCCMLLT
jgi:hypothetical protein